MRADVDLDRLFEPRLSFPDPEAARRLHALVGLEDEKRRLASMLGVLVNPEGLRAWGATHHPGAAAMLQTVLDRPPLVVLAGDVGSGKTELAESIGDGVARAESIDVTLYPLSLSSRGQGRVGEMTTLLSAAFEAVHDEAKRVASSTGPHRGAALLLVDEADALVQSRESDQMHHEDRAGVNAFIRGVDRLARARAPVAVILCTNRQGALDPAILRRAAEMLRFARPGLEQRRAVLATRLAPAGLGEQTLAALADATGGDVEDGVGFTYSDLLQRLIPAIVLDAYPDGPVQEMRAVEIARSMKPTPSFRDSAPTRRPIR